MDRSGQPCVHLVRAEPRYKRFPKQYQNSRIRYRTLYGRYLDVNGKLTAGDVLEGMKEVASSNFNDYRTDGETRRTQWTLVFDQKALTAELNRWEDWG